MFFGKKEVVRAEIDQGANQTAQGKTQPAQAYPYGLAHLSEEGVPTCNLACSITAASVVASTPPWLRSFIRPTLGGLHEPTISALKTAARTSWCGGYERRRVAMCPNSEADFGAHYRCAWCHCCRPKTEIIHHNGQPFCSDRNCKEMYHEKYRVTPSGTARYGNGE